MEQARSFAWLAAFVTLLMSLASVTGPATLVRAQDVAAPTPTTAPATQPETPDHQLKVGVLVSQYTATGPSIMGQPYGYDHVRIVDQLQDPSIQLIPLIEADSETDEKIAQIVEARFPDAASRVVRADDLESLKSLDAIVATRCPNMRDEVLDAMAKAADHGTGLLIVGPVGVLNPGYKEPLLNILGLTDGKYAFVASNQQVEILSPDDPLLKDLTDPEKWTLMPNGSFGHLKPAAKPLIKLQSKDELTYPISQEDNDADFYPLYQTRIGHGAVIVGNWSATMPDAAKELEHPTFYVRCIRRLVELRENPER